MQLKLTLRREFGALAHQTVRVFAIGRCASPLQGEEVLWALRGKSSSP
jgi:hypothetical protein